MALPEGPRSKITLVSCNFEESVVVTHETFDRETGVRQLFKNTTKATRDHRHGVYYDPKIHKNVWVFDNYKINHKVAGLTQLVFDKKLKPGDYYVAISTWESPRIVKVRVDPDGTVNIIAIGNTQIYRDGYLDRMKEIQIFNETC